MEIGHLRRWAIAGVYKRSTDEGRGKAGKWTCWWKGADGKKKSCVGTVNKQESLEIARAKAKAALDIKDGRVDPAERHRIAAAARPILEHLEDFREDMVSRSDDPKHVRNTVSAIRRMFGDVKIEYIADITPDKIQTAMGRIRSGASSADKKGRSARTCNHALGAVKAFMHWLAYAGRIKEYPAGLTRIEPYPQASDRRRVRRPLTIDQLAKLLEVTEASEPFATKLTSRHGNAVHVMSGPDRAMCYRVAMATGFRAQEIRTLTPERFNLDGENPTITVLACYSKRGKGTGRDDVQPIRRDIAAAVRPWLEGKPDGVPVFPLSIDRNAAMLYADLSRAGIEPTDEKGRVIDFHALRHTYVTHLVKAGVNPKIVQKLARHSSITLTLDTYTTLEDGELRDALEGPRTTGEQDSSGRS